MYCIVLTPNYLWSDEVSNHEGKRHHEHFHTITVHIGMFLTINVNIMEVGSIVHGHGDHRGVRHSGYCSETV
jgi:hypothetical protein